MSRPPNTAPSRFGRQPGKLADNYAQTDNAAVPNGRAISIYYKAKGKDVLLGSVLPEAVAGLAISAEAHPSRPRFGPTSQKQPETVPGASREAVIQTAVAGKISARSSRFNGAASVDSNRREIRQVSEGPGSANHGMEAGPPTKCQPHSPLVTALLPNRIAGKQRDSESPQSPTSENKTPAAPGFRSPVSSLTINGYHSPESLEGKPSSFLMRRRKLLTALCQSERRSTLSINAATKINPGTVFDVYMNKTVIGVQEIGVYLQWLEDKEPIAHLWVSREETSDVPAEIIRMNDDLSRFYDGIQPNYFPVQVDQPVAVYVDFKDGKTWTRGVVVDVIKGKIYIHLVDVGGYEEVEGFCEERAHLIQPLDEKFSHSPHLCLRAELAGIPKIQYNAKMGSKIQDIFYDEYGKHQPKTAVVELLELFPVIRVFDTRRYLYPVDIVTLLIQEMEPKISLGVPVFVPNLADDTYDFLMCDVDGLEELQKLQKLIEAAAAKKLPARIHQDAINVVRSPAGIYYRCFIVETLKDGRLLVEFFDYGEVHVVAPTSVYGLPVELQGDSPVVMCRIPGLRQQAAEFQNTTASKLREICGEVCPYRLLAKHDTWKNVVIWSPKDMTVIGENQGTKLIIDDLPFKSQDGDTAGGPSLVSLSSSSIPSSNNGLAMVMEMKYRLPPKEGETIDVIPEYVLDGEWFTALYDSTLFDSDAFLRMMKAFDRECESSPKFTTMPATRTMVCARFSEDRKWYRGTVMVTKSSTKAFILFVDYGNRELKGLEDLRLMDRKWLAVPRGCLLMLDNTYMPAVEQVWSEDDKTAIAKLVVGKPCRFEITYDNTENGMFLGRMWIPLRKGVPALLSEELVRVRLAELNFGGQ